MTRRSTAEIGREWEKQVAEFLSSESGYGFKDVDGGSAFQPDEQIDVVAGHDGVLLIVECKTKSELGKGSLTAEIKKFLTKARRAFRALKAGYKNGKYVKYNRFIPVFATNEIIWTESAIELSGHGEDQVLKWDDQFFDYYRLLLENLGKDSARYQLFGELKIFESQLEIQVPATRLQVRDFTIY